MINDGSAFVEVTSLGTVVLANACPDERSCEIQESKMDEEAEQRLERLRIDHTHSMELFRATLVFEHSALRPSFLLNGGALVVFLALFGAIKTARFSVAGFEEVFAFQAMATWVIGLVFAAAANALAYYSQFAFKRSWDQRIAAKQYLERGAMPRVRHALKCSKRENKIARRERTAATYVILMSMLLFIEGVGLALLSLSGSLRSYVVPLFYCYPYLCPT